MRTRWQDEERPLRRPLLPGWLGPIVGIPIGGALGYQVWTETLNGSLPFYLGVGAGMGALAGFIVWFSEVHDPAGAQAT